MNAGCITIVPLHPWWYIHKMLRLEEQVVHEVRAKTLQTAHGCSDQSWERDRALLEYTKLSVNTCICFSEQKTFFKTFLSIFAWQMNVSHQWSKTQFDLAFLGKKGMFSKSSKSSLTVDYITMNIYSSNSCESAPVVLVVVSRRHLIQGLWNNMFFLHYFNLNSILFPFKHFFTISVCCYVKIQYFTKLLS